MIDIEKNFFSPFDEFVPQSGEAFCVAPGNIALVKYWGKRKGQLPSNPSVSFTLSKCVTRTRLIFSPKKNTDELYDFEIFLDGVLREDFKPKVLRFFERISSLLPFVTERFFRIETSNTFPHSSGIASSASGMSALACALVAVIRPVPFCETTLQMISFLARLGSGSASRSLWGPVVSWGEHKDIKNSSDLWGTALPKSQIHNVFNDYRDTILLVENEQKSVSSSAGHRLMETHPYRHQRFEEADRHVSSLLKILQSGDLEGFVKIVEREALSLHGLMMMSDPYFILMKPQTLTIIQKVQEWRDDTKIPICFTLDAGANVHLLYPKENTEPVLDFIRSELVSYCKNALYISDEVGLGIQEIRT